MTTPSDESLKEAREIHEYVVLIQHYNNGRAKGIERIALALDAKDKKLREAEKERDELKREVAEGVNHIERLVETVKLLKANLLTHQKGPSK